MARVALGNARKPTQPRKGPSSTPSAAATGEDLLPPPGTFDPGLAANIRKSERELEDLIEQAKKEGKRERVDVLQKRREDLRTLHQSLGDIGREKGYSLQDTQYAKESLGIDFTRAITDLGVAKQRGQQDYERTLTDLQHTYATRAVQQQEAGVGQGTDEAGTNAASSAVRGANEAHDKGVIDLSHLRDTEDFLRREGRLGEDLTRNTGRLQTEEDRRLAAFGISTDRAHEGTTTALKTLARTAQRARADRAVTVSHAKRDQGLYASDTAEQAFFQAHKENPSILFPSGMGPNGHPGSEPGPGVGNSKPVYGIGDAYAFPNVTKGYPVTSQPTKYGY